MGSTIIIHPTHLHSSCIMHVCMENPQHFAISTILVGDKSTFLMKTAKIVGAIYPSVKIYCTFIRYSRPLWRERRKIKSQALLIARMVNAYYQILMWMLPTTAGLHSVPAFLTKLINIT